MAAIRAAAWSILLTACAHTAPPPTSEVLQGTWKGPLEIRGTYADGSTASDTLPVRVRLDGGKARVYLPNADFQWKEAYPGSWLVTKHGDTIVMQALNSGGNVNVRWDETCTLTATARADGDLQVEWKREVKNLGGPKDRYSSFAFSGNGILRRESPP